MIQIPQVTLVALTSNHVKGALRSIAMCARHIQFGAIHFLSDRPPMIVEPDVMLETHRLLHGQHIHWDQVPAIHGIADYNRLAVFEIGRHFFTSHVLICHHDGYVTNPESWDPAFLDWDYVGAPWPAGMARPSHRADVVRVGNGGFCLRSRKLYEVVASRRTEFEALVSRGIPEDNIFCCDGRGLVEDAGCRIAPVDVAARFSHENACPEIEAVKHPFGIHFPPASLQKGSGLQML